MNQTYILFVQIHKREREREVDEKTYKISTSDMFPT